MSALCTMPAMPPAAPIKLSLPAQGPLLGAKPSVHHVTLFDSDAVVHKDCNGIILAWSEGATKFFGYTAEEMVGRSILCLFPPDRVNEEFALMQLIQEGQDLSYIETTRCHKDGTSMHIALNLTGIWDADKKLVGIRSAVRHIDQGVYNAQQVQDLLAQTQYLQRIVDHADAAMYSVDLRGRIHSWNTAAEVLFGYHDKDIIGQSVHLLQTEEEQKKWHVVLNNMRAAKQVYSMETVRLHKDSSPINVKITFTPIVNTNQEMIGVSTTVRSIEDKVRARITELSLKRQSKYFEAIVNSSDDAIISHDLRGVVQSWNLSAERLFGYTAKEMMGQSIMRICSSEKESEATRLLDQLLNGAAVNHLNTVRKHKYGSEVHVSLSMSTLTDDTDTVVGISIIARDISERIVAEQTIWQHANFDMLTHLPNQRLLTDRAQQLLPECTRRQEKAAVVYMDLDHLKEVNDELGHLAGDALLVEIANRLSSSIRSQDTVARLGGDEFVVLINGFTDADTIDNIVERIQQTLAEPVRLASREIHVTFSAGVSVYPDDGVQWADLMATPTVRCTLPKKQGATECVISRKI